MPDTKNAIVDFIEAPGAIKNLNKVFSTALQTLEPPPRLNLSEWCDEHRILSKEYNPIGGRWDTSTAPYQKEILDAIGDYKTQEIVLMTSAQVGKTSMIENLLAYHIVFDPAPVLVIFPEGTTLRAFSQDRIDSMIRDMPELTSRVDPKRERDASNTIHTKKFRGGHVTFATAGSARQLRSRPIRILCCDEVDSYDLNVSEEGDPIRLAKVRTANFFNRKIILTSTPTTEDTSRIAKAFQLSDRRYFEVPCPECGTFQRLVFGTLSQYYKSGSTGELRWEENNPDTAYYECVKGHRIEHASKHSMLKQGKWIAENPESKVVGFFINSLYSPWVEWKDLVQEFLEVKNDPFQLQVFVNAKLGETWKQKASVTISDLVTHCDSYDAECPSGVGVITAGVDIQLNRIEVGIYGWGDGEQCWFLDTIPIYKDPGTPEAWEELAKVLNRTFKNVHGAEIPIHAAGIDTGYQPELVRRFVKSVKRKRVYAVVGLNQYGMPILATKPRTAKDGTLVWPVGTDTAKKMIYARFKINEAGPGYVHFPLDSQINLRDVFYQLTSERAVVKVWKGKRVVVFEKKSSGARNEQLDMLVYAMAALYNIGIGVLDKLSDYAKQTTEKVIESAPEPIIEEKKEISLIQKQVREHRKRFKSQKSPWKRGWQV